MTKSIFQFRSFAAGLALAALAIAGCGTVPAYAASGSGIVDKLYIQAGTGAVPRAYGDRLHDAVSVEDFGAKGDGVADDGPKIQAAINSFGNGAVGAVRLSPGRTYKINAGISTNNRSVVIDGNNATILVGASTACGITINGVNTELRNLTVARSAGATVTAGVCMSGLQHVMRNVTSRNAVWPVFILTQDLKESHFDHIRVDNDPTNKTGIIFQMDYSVNNTISDSMLGYAAQAIYGSSIGQPTLGYHNEGLMVSNVIIVFVGKGVNFDNGTFIAIANSCFDFIENIGVFMSNGTDLQIMNTWIASNVTANFIGVGTTSAVDGVSLQNNVFVRGASPIAGTAGVSLSGPNVLVIGNRFKSGMNGGVVTQATSQVVANNISGGGTNIVANLSNATVLGGLNVANGMAVGAGNLTVTSGTLTVNGSQGIFPTGLSGAATAGVNGAPPAQVVGYASVSISGTTYKIPYYAQ